MRPSLSPFVETIFLAALAGLPALAPRPAFAADPTTADCLAANNSSVNLRNLHKLRDARAQLLVCAAQSCPADVQKECLSHLDEVNAQIPTIVFEAKDAVTGKDLSAVRVTMDGQPLADRLEGTAVSVDPGEHTFTFETEGQAPITRQFVLQEAQKDRHEPIVFGTAPLAAPLAPPLAPPVATPAAATAEAPAPPPGGPASFGEAPSRLGGQRIASLVVAGIGVVGIGVGTAFGLMAISKKNDAEGVCPNQCATQSQVNMWNDAKTTGNISTALFIVGGVGLAGGAVLWFTARPSSHAGPQVGIGPGSLQLKGTW